MPFKDQTTSASQTVLTEAGAARAPRPSNHNGCLIVIYGHQIGRRVQVGTEPLTIGRSPNCEIPVDQESVSRRHCRIQLEDGEFLVRDLDSTNGTYVNDAPVDPQGRLRHGDQLMVGRTILKFIVGDDVEVQYHEEIYRLMTTDGLTQLNNRRYFDDMLDREVARAKRYKRTFSLMVFDLDHFKRVNDRFGHLGGDAVLRQLGAILLGRLRVNDVLARIGGEEFALITPEVGLDGATELASKIHRLIGDTRFEFEGSAVKVTVSVGVAEWQHEYEDAGDLLKTADDKMYAAKRAGRNRVCS
ncbi:MAG: GGDEF domain-containing protein [Deltaproteobacteria bacterium]|nr:GGDEF domain-containing protein [Deltaproteobacteria bacterium]NND29352.1 GGDEF domain-containing protein [Myxococcales bacterium]MBT8463410.1 GGDEF domain-containing protein [Deltaproteobacteria bacterium]MBT8480704.1 GGDEF domain-containing protein [Deltaproteobacteria bacterium]NNK09434.1 GGDEF domain-containing protein [Myxococcales bacterium]